MAGTSRAQCIELSDDEDDDVAASAPSKRFRSAPDRLVPNLTDSTEKSTSSLVKALQGEDRKLLKSNARALGFAKCGGFLIDGSMQHTMQRCNDVVHYGMSAETSADKPYCVFAHHCPEMPVNILTCQTGGRQSTEALQLMNVDFKVSSSPQSIGRMMLRNFQTGNVLSEDTDVIAAFLPMYKKHLRALYTFAEQRDPSVVCGVAYYGAPGQMILELGLKSRDGKIDPKLFRPRGTTSKKKLEAALLPHGPPVPDKESNAQYEASPQLRTGHSVFVVELRRAGIVRRRIVATAMSHPRNLPNTNETFACRAYSWSMLMRGKANEEKALYINYEECI
jgi:hypothetical protein